VTRAVAALIVPCSPRIPDDRGIILRRDEGTPTMWAFLRDEGVPIALLVAATRRLRPWMLRHRSFWRGRDLRTHATTRSSMSGMVSADVSSEGSLLARAMQNLSIGAAITVVKTAISTTIA